MLSPYVDVCLYSSSDNVLFLCSMVEHLLGYKQTDGEPRSCLRDVVQPNEMHDTSARWFVDSRRATNADHMSSDSFREKNDRVLVYV